MTAEHGDRRSAEKYLVRALSGFERLREQYQATRTRQIMAALATVRGESSKETFAAQTGYDSPR